MKLLLLLAFAHVVVDTVALALQPLWPDLRSRLALGDGEFQAAYVLWNVSELWEPGACCKTGVAAGSAPDLAGSSRLSRRDRLRETALMLLVLASRVRWSQNARRVVFLFFAKPLAWPTRGPNPGRNTDGRSFRFATGSIWWLRQNFD